MHSKPILVRIIPLALQKPGDIELKVRLRPTVPSARLINEALLPQRIEWGWPGQGFRLILTDKSCLLIMCIRECCKSHSMGEAGTHCALMVT